MSISNVSMRPTVLVPALRTRSMRSAIACVGVDQRAQFTIVESLVSEAHGRQIAHLDRRHRFRIRLNPEYVDIADDAGAVTVPDEDAIARDTQTPARRRRRRDRRRAMRPCRDRVPTAP